jgi:hypothetical protein
MVILLIEVDKIDMLRHVPPSKKTGEQVSGLLQSRMCILDWQFCQSVVNCQPDDRDNQQSHGDKGA